MPDLCFQTSHYFRPVCLSRFVYIWCYNRRWCRYMWFSKKTSSSYVNSVLCIWRHNISNWNSFLIILFTCTPDKSKTHQFFCCKSITEKINIITVYLLLNKYLLLSVINSKTIHILHHYKLQKHQFNDKTLQKFSGI